MHLQAFKWCVWLLSGVPGLMSSVWATPTPSSQQDQPNVLLRGGSNRNYSEVVQWDVPWNLAAISHSSRRSGRMWPARWNQKYAYRFQPSKGRSSYVYIINSGILKDHRDFEDRVESGYSAVEKECGRGSLKLGTHIAGVVGGLSFGVAKKAEMIDVQAWSETEDEEHCGGDAELVEALKWSFDAIHERGQLGKAVILLSKLPGGPSRPFELQIQDILASNIPIVIASGPIDHLSPGFAHASGKKALLVGASDKRYHRMFYPGFENPVDIFAPGEDILSASNRSEWAYEGISGVGQAAAHVAGVIAYHFDVSGPMTSEDIWKKLKKDSKNRLILFANKSWNRFLSNGYKRGARRRVLQWIPEFGHQSRKKSSKAGASKRDGAEVLS